MVSFQHQKRWCIVGIYWDITGIHDHTWLAEKPPSKTGAEMGTSSINGLYIYILYTHIYPSYIFSIAMFDYQRTFFLWGGIGPAKFHKDSTIVHSQQDNHWKIPCQNLFPGGKLRRKIIFISSKSCKTKLSKLLEVPRSVFCLWNGNLWGPLSILWYLVKSLHSGQVQIQHTAPALVATNGKRKAEVQQPETARLCDGVGGSVSDGFGGSTWINWPNMVLLMCPSIGSSHLYPFMWTTKVTPQP